MSGPRLSIIPARACTDPQLKPRDLQVLCVLGRHTDDAGWCRKSQVKMAEEMGCARSTVFDAIERLVAAGYLERYVQETQSGRDSPHVYRVILDPKHADMSAVRDVDSDAPDGRSDPCRYTGTPADISAPPAGPEPAPPAGPGPAPKNDSLGTTSSERTERETRARESDEEGQRVVRRWLKRTHPRWPTFVSDSEPRALAAALALTDDERHQADSRMDDYLASSKAGGRTTVCTFAVYLAEKRWEKLPASVERPISDYAPPFGPVWGCWRIAHLLGRRGPWPMVEALHQQARMGRGHRFGERWHGLKGLTEPVPVGTALFEEWRALHLERGWPWLPDPGEQRVIYFPAGGPGGLEAFERAVADSVEQINEAAQ